MSQSFELLKDPSRFWKHPPSGFRCGETIDNNNDNEHDDDDEEEVGSVTFHVALPDNQRMVFGCRDRSVGVLMDHEEAVKDDDIVHEQVDEFFFDKGYTLAGRTGFQVWAGSRLLLESLTWPNSSFATSSSSSSSSRSRSSENNLYHQRLAEWHRKITEGGKVIELGAGVGVVGACLAAVGAQVLLTDLPTLVENAIQPNLVRNQQQTDHKHTSTTEVPPSPTWLSSCSSSPTRIGNGWAGAAALDWTVPVEQQLAPNQYEGIDLIVASDCVWLVSMLNALLNTVESLFHTCAATANTKPPVFLMSFQRRDAAGGDGSDMFTTVNRVVEAIEARKWTMECLAWRYVRIKTEEDTGGGGEENGGDNDDTTLKEVFIFEIKPN